MRTGKRVRGSLYLHRAALACLSPDDQSRIAAASQDCPFEWNVVRVARGELALLRYADFDGEPFPSLEASFSTRDGAETAVTRDYSARANPPVLHRKELLVSPDHPRRAEWEALTQHLLARGAFEDAHRIGTKTAWAARLASLGLGADGRSDD